MCVLVLPVSRLLHLKAEVTTCVGNVIETFIVVMFVNIVQLVCDIYIYIYIYIYAHYGCIFRECGLFIIIVVISKLVGKIIVSV